MPDEKLPPAGGDPGQPPGNDQQRPGNPTGPGPGPPYDAGGGSAPPPYPQWGGQPTSGYPGYGPTYGPGGYPHPQQAAPYPQPDARRPAVWPVVIFTLLFGVFGSISAALRSRRARRLGLPIGKYWAAFAATLVVFIAVVVAIAVESSSTPPVMTAAQLQTSLVQSAGWTDSLGNKLTAKDATCVPDNVASNGVGTYRCIVDFTDGARVSDLVTVGPDGSYVTSPG